jgi:hypothetical protein
MNHSIAPGPGQEPRGSGGGGRRRRMLIVGTLMTNGLVAAGPGYADDWG